MPIRIPAAPPDAAAALAAFMPTTTGPLHAHAAAEAALDVSAPHPVYTAGAADIVAGSVLAAAQLVGWRAIISTNAAALAAAEVSPLGELAYLNEGPFVEGSAAAIESARQRFDGDFELRLLRLPAVYTLALWLHAGDADVLIPVAPAPPGLVPNEPIGEGAFTAALRALAEQVIAGPIVT